MNSSVRQISRPCLVGLLVALSALSPQRGSGQDGFDVVDRRIQSMGGLSSLADARPGDLITLLGHLTKRATLLADLYEYQSRLGALYGYQRMQLDDSPRRRLPSLYWAVNLGHKGGLEGKS